MPKEGDWMVHLSSQLCSRTEVYKQSSYHPLNIFSNLNLASSLFRLHEAVQIRENEAQETAARNSEINTILMNSLVKHTQALFSLL
jgi:hypothetical protein